MENRFLLLWFKELPVTALCEAKENNQDFEDPLKFERQTDC